MTISGLIRYFLYLGVTGFGGPIAVVSYMHRDLVVKKKWFSEETFSQGLALSQVSPGPLSTQLSGFLGWTYLGTRGALLATVSFMLPSYLIVLILGHFYLQYGDMEWIKGVLYGINAAVIPLVAVNGYRLFRKTAGSETLRWILAVLGAGAALAFGSRSIIAVLIAGLVYLGSKNWPRSRGIKMFSVDPVSALLLLKMFFYFFKMGAIVYGGGLVIVPFLESGVVRNYGWLTETQFLDSVAVGMVTPGPILMSVAFMGLLRAGLLGSLVCLIGIFLPAFLLTLIVAPRYNKIVKNPRVKDFVTGISCAAVGMICSSVYTLGKVALADSPAIGIAVVVACVMIWARKIPDPILIVGSGVVGFFIRN